MYSLKFKLIIRAQFLLQAVHLLLLVSKIESCFRTMNFTDGEKIE